MSWELWAWLMAWGDDQNNKIRNKVLSNLYTLIWAKDLNIAQFAVVTLEFLNPAIWKKKKKKNTPHSGQFFSLGLRREDSWNETKLS